MENILYENEAERIVTFLKDTAARTGIKTTVIGWSGGIDSTLSLYLLHRAFGPDNIHILHMPYSVSYTDDLGKISWELGLKRENTKEVSIKTMVDTVWKELGQEDDNTPLSRIRRGNIMARLRMIALFDLAKKTGGLVCGTENRTEHLLGYFTRYGDGASDIEPIQHLYKTQVYGLARFLNVAEPVLKRAPSAGLWQGQTDEGEFGFTYEEADHVLALYYDRKKTAEEIKKKGFPNAEAIIAFSRRNSFKHEVPYSL